MAGSFGSASITQIDAFNAAGAGCILSFYNTSSCVTQIGTAFDPSLTTCASGDQVSQGLIFDEQLSDIKFALFEC